MSISHTLGKKPDLFLTVTANVEWAEIQEALPLWQASEDRPELLARAFRRRSLDIVDDVMTRGIFGRAAGYALSYEWQKRGEDRLVGGPWSRC